MAVSHGVRRGLANPETWPEPAITTVTDTTNYGKAETEAWDRVLRRPWEKPGASESRYDVGKTVKRPETLKQTPRDPQAIGRPGRSW
ncbi:hypothetical protein [Streptomyces albicerus]|uniref:hypothetical protein n=1 Tax=Streptomyces albicerus TaxID=2569859 RepID=UPI001CEC72BE